MAEANRVAVRVSDLRYSYPNGVFGHAALDGVDLTVMKGEKVALLGPNGAGKTTLLLHLNGLLQGSGDVEVFGRRVLDADKAELAMIRARVGLIFQDPDDQLFSNTVAEDVAFGPIHMGLDTNEVQARVESAMADVGLSGFGDRAPYHLSGGEKRRSAIATVLSMRPEIIVADEPSAGLGPEGEARAHSAHRNIASNDVGGHARCGPRSGGSAEVRHHEQRPGSGRRANG